MHQLMQNDRTRRHHIRAIMIKNILTPEPDLRLATGLAQRPGRRILNVVQRIVHVEREWADAHQHAVTVHGRLVRGEPVHVGAFARVSQILWANGRVHVQRDGQICELGIQGHGLRGHELEDLGDVGSVELLVEWDVCDGSEDPLHEEIVLWLEVSEECLFVFCIWGGNR